ncbi:hypothetical protein BCEP27_160058 [Burkholderia cepacia]
MQNIAQIISAHIEFYVTIGHVKAIFVTCDT